jgi:predicted TIM-barrel fold metal-dependent hydrolase
VSSARQAAHGLIIDCHAHIASCEYFPPPFMDGVIDNMMCVLGSRGARLSRRKVEELYTSRFQDPECDQLVSEMDAAGIARSVLLLADFTFALRGCSMTVAEMLSKHVAVARRHPGRFLTFAGIDPRWGQDGLGLFESAAARGEVHGFKVYPPCGFNASDRRLYPFYEVCKGHALPVLVHVGATSPALGFESSRPIHLDDAARDFPAVKFILAHGSVHYPDECVMMCKFRPNVYLDVSGYEVEELALVRHVLSAGINHKVLFGTDWPFFRLRGTQKDFVDLLLEGDDVFPAKMSVGEIEGFFFGNAAGLLRGAPTADQARTAV